MPHLLVAGTTGSGKSVCTNAMILSVLYKASPDQVKFIMVDPKMLELSLYEGIPHLLLPVVTDPKKASLALQWAVDEMERRYKLLSSFKVRNIDGFNHKLGLLRKQRAAEAARRAAEAAEAERASQPPVEAEAEPVGLPTESDPDEGIELVPEGKRIDDLWVGEEIPKDLPFIVVLIDEFADLMCVAPRDVEGAVQRLAQKARASGIHLIIATQRPSTDVITGVIKNNLPTRMSFRVASRHDSATIINQPGAENLLGMGDMLYLSNATPTPVRVHGAYVSEEEVQRVVEFWKAQGSPSYDEAILKPRDADGEGGVDEDADEMYDEAVRVVTETQKASISALQRRLRVGYNRAARMIEMMEREGIVSEAMGPKGEREVLVREMSPDGPPRV
jgi:S-DNA-T family DNA segregation ATPase FtsK/SpoIIIE